MNAIQRNHVTAEAAMLVTIVESFENEIYRICWVWIPAEFWIHEPPLIVEQSGIIMNQACL